MGKPSSDAMTKRSRLSRWYVWMPTLLMSIACGLLLVRAQLHLFLIRKRPSRRIHELGGRITRDETKPGHPVIFVTLTGERVVDADLALLTGMKELKILGLENTKITGDGLDRLEGLTSLSGLNLLATEVTDFRGGTIR